MFTIELTIRHDDGTMTQITRLARGFHTHGEPVWHQLVQNTSRLETVKAAIRVLEIEQQFMEETGE